MFKITPEISQKFRCSQCREFLSAKPIRANPNNTQICASCYELLSDEDKEKYVPQTAFENIAELFIFPCRYKSNGCNYEHSFNQPIQEHERYCRYKFDKPSEKALTIGNKLEVVEKDNYICGRGTTAFERSSIASNEINLEVDFETCDNLYANRTGAHHVKYSFRIEGKEGYQLCLRNSQTQTEINYAKIIGEGVLSLEIAGNTLNHVELESQSDITSYEKACNICQNSIEGSVYHCLFGHDACNECKGKTCNLCQTAIMGESKSYCRNRHKGCSILDTSEVLLKHEIDCEFNNFRCPFPRCVFLNSLTDLKNHFLISHKNNLIRDNHISEMLNGKKDKKWYFYYCDSLFVCTYFYFVTSIEFIVQYVGANDKAKTFTYELNIQPKKTGEFKKRSVCAGWNETSLCKGICYEFEDLADWEDARFQLGIDLRILHGSSSYYTSL